MNGKYEESEKKKNSGNPIFILIIFAALIGFIFYMPEVYKKYNSEIANFLGIGSSNNSSIPKNDNDISPVSAYYQLGSYGALDFNELHIENISIDENKIITMTISSKNTVNLDDLNYYVEFYIGRQTFVGRRSLSGIVEGSLTVKIDVSKLNVDTTTYMVLSHIDDTSIPKYDVATDESGTYSLNCLKENNIYLYDFDQSGLIKVTNKYTYTNYDLNSYTSVLIEYKKKSDTLDELNGVTSIITENGTSFILVNEYDYTKINEFKVAGDKLIFNKNTLVSVIKFKMDAEGYDCE